MPPDLTELKTLYPFKSNFIDVRGVRMHYIDEGEGETLLMLHGNPTWSFYYRELVKVLRGQYRVIVPDHIGCGLSDKPQRYAYNLANHIANVESLATELKLKDLTLVVHDWGGAIGFGWARKHPESVRRLVVFNTAAFTGPCPFRIRICTWPLIGTLAIRGLNGFAAGAVRQACKHRERMTADVKRGYLLPYDNWANRIANLQFVRDIPLRDSHPTYPLIKEIERSLQKFKDRPALVMWGAQDFCFNDWYFEQWKIRLPQATFHHFEDAGHYVVEDAHERILPLMQEFLQTA